MGRTELHSVVVPMYDEVEVAEEFWRRTTDAMSGLDYELVIVDNGSTDGTYEALARLQSADPRLRIVRLSRNFTHQGGITAGIDYARGDTVTVLDGDLQDPPELIPKMIERWRDGADIVFAVRSHRKGESAVKRGTAKLFYRMLRTLADVDIPLDAGDFRLMSRRAAEALRGMRERSRYIRGMTGWIGLTRDYVEYQRDARFAGETKYPLRDMMRLATDGVVSFSARPLQIATWLGFAASGVGLVVLVWVLTQRFTDDRLAQGWASLMVALLFFGGAQLVTLGIMGSYVARIYDEVRHRPLYLVRDVRGFPNEDGEIAYGPLPARDRG